MHARPHAGVREPGEREEPAVESPHPSANGSQRRASGVGELAAARFQSLEEPYELGVCRLGERGPRPPSERLGGEGLVVGTRRERDVHLPYPMPEPLGERAVGADRPRHVRGRMPRGLRDEIAGRQARRAAVAMGCVLEECVEHLHGVLPRVAPIGDERVKQPDRRGRLALAADVDPADERRRVRVTGRGEEPAELELRALARLDLANDLPDILTIEEHARVRLLAVEEPRRPRGCVHRGEPVELQGGVRVRERPTSRQGDEQLAREALQRERVDDEALLQLFGPLARLDPQGHDDRVSPPRAHPVGLGPVHERERQHVRVARAVLEEQVHEGDSRHPGAEVEGESGAYSCTLHSFGLGPIPAARCAIGREGPLEGGARRALEDRVPARPDLERLGRGRRSDGRLLPRGLARHRKYSKSCSERTLRRTTNRLAGNSRGSSST